VAFRSTQVSPTTNLQMKSEETNNYKLAISYARCYMQ
jgi:hypothetical protein